MKTNLIGALIQFREECKAQGRTEVAQWVDGALPQVSTAEAANLRIISSLRMYEAECYLAGYAETRAFTNQLISQLDGVLIREAQQHVRPEASGCEK
jgi:hypothetical protein